MGDSPKDSHANGTVVTSAQLATANTDTLVLLTSTATATTNGVVLNPANHSFSVGRSGVYNIQFSIQATNHSNVFDNFTVWYVKNGTAVPSSASQGTVRGRHTGDHPGAVILTVNIYLVLIPTDVVQLYWTSIYGKVAIITGSANPGASFPIIPSTLLSIVQLS